MLWKTIRRIIENLRDIGNLEKKVDSILKEVIAHRREVKKGYKREIQSELPSQSVETQLSEPFPKSIEGKVEPSTESYSTSERVRENQHTRVNQEEYKIDYERINELYQDPNKRMRILDQAKKRVGKLNKKELKVWFSAWCSAYYKSKAYEKAEKDFKRYVREDLNWQAKKKIKNNPKYNLIQVTRSAYEKAKYASKRVIDLSGKDLEIRFSSFSDKNTGIIDDFFIPYQKVDDVTTSPLMGRSEGVAARLGKKVGGLAHSHANMSTFHSAIDNNTLKNMCSAGYNKIMDFHNGNKEKNKKFNFKIRYASSIVFNAKMFNNSDINPFISIGYWVHKLETDENGNGKRGWEYFSRDSRNNNIKIQIIEDGKEFNKELVDKEIKERVFTNRDIRDRYRDKSIETALETITPTTYIPFKSLSLAQV